MPGSRTFSLASTVIFSQTALLFYYLGITRAERTNLLILLGFARRAHVTTGDKIV